MKLVKIAVVKLPNVFGAIVVAFLVPRVASAPGRVTNPGAPSIAPAAEIFFLLQIQYE